MKKYVQEIACRRVFFHKNPTHWPLGQDPPKAFLFGVYAALALNSNRLPINKYTQSNANANAFGLHCCSYFGCLQAAGSHLVALLIVKLAVCTRPLVLRCMTHC